MIETFEILWPQVGMLIATVILVLITVISTIFYYLFFRSQVEPEVIVYTDSDDRRPSIILLVIENIGKGMAYNVSFHTDKPLPEKAWGFNEAKMPNKMSRGPIITGIPAFGPGSKRVITWGQYGGLHKYLKDKSIDITICFESNRSIFPGKKKQQNVCPVEVISFAGTDDSDHNWDKNLYEEVKRIRIHIEN